MAYVATRLWSPQHLYARGLRMQQGMLLAPRKSGSISSSPILCCQVVVLPAASLAATWTAQAVQTLDPRHIDRDAHRFEDVAALHIAGVRRLHHHAVVLHRALQELLQVALLGAGRLLRWSEGHHLLATVYVSICAPAHSPWCMACVATKALLTAQCMGTAAWSSVSDYRGCKGRGECCQSLTRPDTSSALLRATLRWPLELLALSLHSADSHTWG